MNGAEVLSDAFGRLPELVHGAVDGLATDQLNERIDGTANHIGWLVWHLTRVQDDHLADAAGGAQLWTTDGWAERFGLPLESGETGWGQASDQVDLVRIADGSVLVGYYEAVHVRTVAYLADLTDADLDRVVDDNVGSAGDPRGPAGERDGRLPGTRRPGQLRPGDPGTALSCRRVPPAPAGRGPDRGIRMPLRGPARSGADGGSTSTRPGRC